MGDQLVVYSLDDEAQSKLSDAGILCFRYAADPGHKWSDWHTPGFSKITSFKYAVALDIFKANKNVLFVDSDIVFLRNPADYLQSVITQSSSHLVMQFESPKNVYNAGFWFATPTRPVIELFSQVWSALQTVHYTSDQNTLNERLPQIHGITTYALDPDLFACGNRFLVSEERRKTYIDTCGRPFDADSAYILHFNYVVGKEAKASAMKKHGAMFYPGLAKYSRRKILVVAKRLMNTYIRRAGVVRKALSGQPVTEWPRLISKLLMEKKARGIQRID
jgi:hypothetical protein